MRLCVDKYLEGRVQRALFDDYRKGRLVEINLDANAWMISIASVSYTHLDVYKRQVSEAKIEAEAYY